jgi:hypothetical protein
MTEVALDEAARIDIETAELTGSISLIGGRIDDLSLGIQRNAGGGLAHRAPPRAHRRGGTLLCALRLGTRG